MPPEEITDGASYYTAFLDLLAEGVDDKQIARKMSCSRGEVKRRRTYFVKQGVLKEDSKVDKKKLTAWLKSDAGQKAQEKWEAQVQKKQKQKINPAFQQQGYQKPMLKQAWSRRKV